MALSQSVVSELLEAFRAGEGVDLIRESVRLVMQELIEAEATELIGAGRYERTESRVTDRNGSRPRLVATQAGDVELRIPKLRKGSFFPAILEPRRRIDQALYAVVMEAYVHGVSTRAVDDLVAALGDRLGISKSGGVADLRRPGRGGRPRSAPGRWTTPSSRTCSSTPPTCTCAPPPARSPRWPSWSPPGSPPTAAGRSSASTSATARTRCSGAASCAALKQRGLAGVRLVISDQHAGLVAALEPGLPRRRHQRCRVHFARNLLALVPKSHKDMVAAVFRTIFAQPDAATVAATWDTSATSSPPGSPRSGR